MSWDPEFCCITRRHCHRKQDARIHVGCTVLEFFSEFQSNDQKTYQLRTQVRKSKFVKAIQSCTAIDQNIRSLYIYNQSQEYKSDWKILKVVHECASLAGVCGRFSSGSDTHAISMLALKGILQESAREVGS